MPPQLHFVVCPKPISLLLTHNDDGFSFIRDTAPIQPETLICELQRTRISLLNTIDKPFVPEKNKPENEFLNTDVVNVSDNVNVPPVKSHNIRCSATPT